uniref:Uncharacterized protein n=1 Tax=Leptobrachium leishanense TaxID=445787 RepID=A0A8C5QLL6_9ANUR
MAVQLCHLIISLECDKAKYDGRCWNIEKITEDLSKATNYFADSTIRLSAQCDDRSLKEELDKAANTVLIMGKNMLLAVQKLYIQPNVQKHQEELITQAQNILLGTLKILQLEDNADILKICQAADWVLGCLVILQTADTMPQLLICFHEFSEALLLLNCLTERRIMDLKDSVHQEHLSGTLKILRKCVPMLYTATKSNIAHKQNEQLVASKQYVFDLATKTVQKLKPLLTHCTIKEVQVKKRITFGQQVHHLSRILTNINCTELKRNGIDFYVGTIIFYSMFVADCSRPDVKLRLVKHCQCILDFRKKLLDQLMSQQEVLSLTNIHMELEKIGVYLKDELNRLNETLVMAIVYLIQGTFSDVKDPLKILLKASLKTSRKTGLQVQKTLAVKTFPTLLHAFHSHTNQLLKVASLVMAHCSEETTTEEIESSVDDLCKIREDLAALFVAISKTQCANKMYEQAQSIYQRWVQTTENLLVNFDGMMTVHKFVHLLVKEVAFNSHSCKTLMESKNCEGFHQHGTDLCGLVTRVIQIVSRYVDRSQDPIFRNGLRVLVRQLEGTLSVTKSIIGKCLDSTSCGTAQRLFLEKTKSMSEMLYNVQEGVNGYKHPDLMSPLRTEVHPVPTHKPFIVDFYESAEMPQNPSNTYVDCNTCLFSYEAYLSKPLPLSCSISNAITSRSITEDTKHLADLQPVVDNLRTAIKKQDQKEVYTISSSLIEIAKTYIDAARELAASTEVDKSQTLSYKDIEPMASHLVQFSKNVNNNSDLNMADIIHNVSFLSHRIEETKKYLLPRTAFWYNFAYQLFCSPACSIARNFQPLHRIMSSLEEIVKLLRESFSSTCKDQEFTPFSSNREAFPQIETGWTKLQATTKYLLTKGFSSGLNTNKAKVEAKCVLWSVTIQQVLTSIVECTNINNLFAPETINLTMLNIAESKGFALLCETSLWLQEAALLSVDDCSKRGEKDNIGNLKEQVESLTEAILKARDHTNMPLVPSILLTAESVLQQRELAVKLKYVVYHLKNVYKRYRNAVQNVVNLTITMTRLSDNDKRTVQGILERDAGLLVENIKFTKQILEDKLPLGKHDDLIFLADHLFFLTIHILSRARAIVESQQCWDIFMLEAMSLNWSAKAHQLFLHLKLYTDLDDATSDIIKQCLQMNGPPGKQKTYNSEVPFESESLKNCIGSVEINVGKGEDFVENKQIDFTKKNVVPNEKPSYDMFFEQKSLFDDKIEETDVNKLYNVSVENQNEDKAQKQFNKSNCDAVVSDMAINDDNYNKEHQRCHEKSIAILNKDVAKNNQSKEAPVDDMENSQKLVNQKEEIVFKQEITNEFVKTFKEEAQKIDRMNDLVKYDAQIACNGTNQDSAFVNTQTVLRTDGKRKIKRYQQKVNEASNLTSTDKEIEKALGGSAKQKPEISPVEQNTNEPKRPFKEKLKMENHKDQVMNRSEIQLKLNRVQENLETARTQTALSSDAQVNCFKQRVHEEPNIECLGNEPEISLNKTTIKKTDIVQENEVLIGSTGTSEEVSIKCSTRQQALDISKSQQIFRGERRHSLLSRPQIALKNDLQEKMFSLAWAVAKNTQQDRGNEKPPGMSFRGLRKGKVNVEEQKVNILPLEAAIGQTYRKDKCPLEEELESWEDH